MAEETTPTTEMPTEEPAAAPDTVEAAPEPVKTLGPESLMVRLEVDATQAIAAIKEAAEGVGSKFADMEARIHQEVDVMWENLRTNVSSVVPTTIHNFMHGEMEGLKARVSSLFHKEV